MSLEIRQIQILSSFLPFLLPSFLSLLRIIITRLIKHHYKYLCRYQMQLETRPIQWRSRQLSQARLTSLVSADSIWKMYWIGFALAFDLALEAGTEIWIVLLPTIFNSSFLAAIDRRRSSDRRWITLLGWGKRGTGWWSDNHRLMEVIGQMLDHAVMLGKERDRVMKR